MRRLNKSLKTIPIEQRLKHIFDALEISIYQISKDLGENPSKFYNLLSGRAKPSYDTITSLLAYYPQINVNYIMQGIEPVLIDPTSTAALRSLEAISEIPFVPIRFYASFVESYIDGVYVTDQETFPVRKEVVKKYKKPVVIEISGNSMTPQLTHGAKVLAVPVGQNDWEYQSGGVYAVMYRDYFVVKRIRENELLTRQMLTLHSDNPNGGTVTVAMRDLRAIWRVVSIVEAPVE